MNAFTLLLMDGHRTVAFEDVTGVVAADASGQFGIEAGHADFVTVLEPGLLRYRRTSQPGWSWAASVGGALDCGRADAKTRVRIVSGRFLFGDEPEALQSGLEALLVRENALRVSTRESRTKLDVALAKRLQQLAETPS